MSSRKRPSLGAALVRIWVVLLACGAVWSWAPSAHAYPWMIRHGFAKCASCHEDPSGGETLTGMGRVISDTTLSTRYDGSKEPTRNAQLLHAIEEPRWLRVGGSLRYMTMLYSFPKGGADGEARTFPMQIDAYGQLHFGPVRVGGSLGVAKVPPTSPYAKAAQVTSNNDGEQFNLLSRSHWVGLDLGDAWLLRAGRMNLPFGVRIPEHVMWVRNATRTDRESAQQHGLALAYSAGKIRGEVMGIAGNYQISPDKYRERGYSAYGEYLLAPRAAVGISSLVTNAKEDRILLNGEGNTRQAHGVMARVGVLPPLSVLAEADVLLSTTRDVGYVGMVQADYEFAQGLHAMVTGEALDAGKPTNAVDKTPGAGEPRFGGWLSFGWFFFTHFDMRADLVFRQEAPVTFQSQLHYYF